MNNSLIQGSDEWLALRKNKITATDASVIMGESPFKTPYTLWQEKLGLKAPDSLNAAMLRGMLLEEDARLSASSHLEIELQPKVVFSPIIDYLMASLDGISEDGKIIVEIKCMGPKNHKNAMEGMIPSYYKAQMQHQMVVSNCETLYFFAYNPNSCKLIAVQKDDEYIKRMLELEAEFWECMQTLTPPKMTEMEKFEMAL